MLVFLTVLIFISSFILTGAIRAYLMRKAILDVPNERSSHIKPTPRGGGIAIAVMFFLGVIWLGWQSMISLALVKALLGGGILIAVTGYWDDLKSLSASVRLVLHFLAAFWALYCLGGFPILDLGIWKIHLGWVGSIFAAAGIVWLINLYNFMDGIDGLAGSEALFVSVTGALGLYLMGITGMAAVCCFLAAAILGFLLWNWPPAKIFLGDVGSGLLGYVFALLALASANQHQLPIIYGLTLLAIFIFDATFTLLHRMIRRERWYAAHCQHVYQRLVQQGATHAKVTLGISLMNILILVPVVYVMYRSPFVSPWLFLGLMMFFLLIWSSVIRRTRG